MSHILPSSNDAAIKAVKEATPKDPFFWAKCRDLSLRVEHGHWGPGERDAARVVLFAKEDEGRK